MAEKEKAGPVETETNAASEERADGGDEVVGEREQPSEAATVDAPIDGTVGDNTSDTADDEVVALQKRIEELEAENTELKNQYLRKQADMENYRKRMIRDKENAVQFSNQQLLLDMTSIIDDFERAIRSAEESRDYDSFHDGIVLIENQLTSMLERKWGLKRFDSEGELFDPQKHEAVTTETRDDHEHSVVLEDYQKGYMLHDRVLRSAKVKVSMPAENNEQ